MSQEERDKRKALDLAAVGGPRTQPMRAAVTALQPETYVEDGPEFKDAWSHLQLALAELGVTLPDRVLERQPRFSSETLVGQNLDYAIAVLRCLLLAGARLVTVNKDATELLLSKFEASIHRDDEDDTSFSDLLSRACTMILTVKDNEHRRVLRASIAHLPDGVVQQALADAWGKLSLEEKMRVHVDGVEVHKPRLSLEGDVVPAAQQPTALALKRKRTEGEARSKFSRRTRENGQKDFAQLTKGGQLESTQLVKARFADKTVYDALNFIVGRGVLRAGHTQVAFAGRAPIGSMAYYEVDVSASKLFEQYSKTSLDASNNAPYLVGRRTFAKLFHAVAKSTTQIACLSPPYVRNLNAFKVLKQLLTHLAAEMVQYYGPDEPKSEAWREYLDLDTTPAQLSARLDALKEHLSSKTFCKHVVSLEAGASPASCDRDAAHCARFATDIGCPGQHTYKCVPCAELFLLPPLVWKIVQAVRNSLSRQFPNQARFQLLAQAKATSDVWAFPTPDPDLFVQDGRRMKEPPELASRIVHQMQVLPPSAGIEAITDAVLGAWPSVEKLPPKSMVKSVLHIVAVKEKRVGDFKQRWYVREDAVPPAPPPPPPIVEAAATTTTTTTTTTTEASAMAAASPFRCTFTGSVARNAVDMMAAARIAGNAIKEYAGHMIRGQIQTSAEKHMISQTDANACVINFDYKNKQIPQSHREGQTDYFGKRGMDLQGVVYISRGTSDSIEHKFVDLIPSTADHTVELMVATLEPIIKHAASLGFKTVDVWTDGASNYKSLALIPLIVHANRERWGCNVFMRSWNYSEAGDGKGPVDVHFALVNRWLKASIDGGKDVTTPAQYYVSAAAILSLNSSSLISLPFRRRAGRTHGQRQARGVHFEHDDQAAGPQGVCEAPAVRVQGAEGAVSPSL